MIYTEYIVKKRVRGTGISGRVNIPWGTILPVANGYILFDGLPLCGVKSQRAKDHFWGYDRRDPDYEIKRQEVVAELLKTAPADDGEALLDPGNTWRLHGYLEEMPGAWEWAWNDAVEDYSAKLAAYLLDCIKAKKQPEEDPKLWWTPHKS